MKDLNRYVKKQFAVDWKDIALELNLNYEIIDDIEKEKSGVCEDCFSAILKEWLRSNVTWKTLEVAIINANRINSGLDPIDDDEDGNEKFMI